jgi:non-homologous end joining protein Ku
VGRSRQGYEYAKNRFVVLTRDDFKTAALEQTKTIDVMDFVDASLESPWNPDKYTDESKDNLMRIIHARLKGKRPKLIAGEHTPKQAEVVDLMERLRASLEGASRPGSARKPAASKSG